MSEQEQNVIIIDDQYAIVVDEMNYILTKIRHGKSGKVSGKQYYQNLKFYNTPSEALGGYYQASLRESLRNGSQTLSEALNAISECSKSVERTIRSAMPDYEVKLVKKEGK